MIEELILTAVKSIALYIIVLIFLRLLGKKRVAELSPVDLIFVVFIGSTLGQQLPEGNKFAGAVVALSSLALFNYLMNCAIRKSDMVRKLLMGKPVVLVSEGKVVKENLKDEKITIHDIEEAMREKEIDDLSDIKLAVLETDGKINVIR